MGKYSQIWFPSGSPIGGDAQAGRGAFTKRHLHIDYIPLGDSGDPALTVSSNPQDITGLDVPALKVEAGVNSQGDAILIEKFSETGAFLTGEFQGADVFSVEGDGDIWNTGTMYAHKANVGGISAAVDGTTELDMTLGNLFTCTPAENTVWSAANPVDETNGIGGQLATFVVDNAGGYTVSWGTGFTNVDAIGAGDTGISVRTLQFDGTTWHQVASTLDGESTNVTSGSGVFREIATDNIFGPLAAGRDAVTGSRNFATIDGAGDALTSGSDNILVGDDAGGTLTEGNRNVFIGELAGFSETTGDDNVGIASSALFAIVAGNDNVAIGPNAMGDVRFGDDNIAIGDGALFSGGVGSSIFFNIAIGAGAIAAITTGDNNIGIGQKAILDLTTGDDNIGIGRLALGDLTTGNGNVSIGYNSGAQLTTSSSKNVCIGDEAGPSTSADHDDELYIDNHQTDSPLIEGDFAGHTIDINGTLSKTAGSFKIQHPKDEAKFLYHGFIEGPEYGLIYRGKVKLKNGKAVIHINESCGMMAGTFEALVQNITIQLQNMTGFVQVRPDGEIIGDKLEIIAEHASEDTISWEVKGERKDEFVMNSNHTDAEGHLILERPKKKAA